MKKLESRTNIKFFFKKGMHLKEIHEDVIETLGKESPSYSTVNKIGRRVKGRGRVCYLRSIASEVGICFGAVQSILKDILGM